MYYKIFIFLNKFKWALGYLVLAESSLGRASYIIHDIESLIFRNKDSNLVIFNTGRLKLIKVFFERAIGLNNQDNILILKKSTLVFAIHCFMFLQDPKSLILSMIPGFKETFQRSWHNKIDYNWYFLSFNHTLDVILYFLCIILSNV